MSVPAQQLGWGSSLKGRPRKWQCVPRPGQSAHFLGKARSGGSFTFQKLPRGAGAWEGRQEPPRTVGVSRWRSSPAGDGLLRDFPKAPWNRFHPRVLIF